jgi:hypothetical protein
MGKNNFIFVGDLLETDANLPLHLFEDYYFNKASEFQIERIKRIIENYTGLSFIGNKYEHSYSPHENGYTISPMNEDNWKYFVIEHSHDIKDLKIFKTFALSSLDLTILFETYENGTFHGGKFMLDLTVINYFYDERYRTGIPKIKVLNSESIEELKHLNYLLSIFNKEQYPFIDKALSDFMIIKDISVRSPFRILSYFSILELLLTSSKSKTSNNSSLSNQLKKKVNLLNNQFKNKLEIENYFKGSNTFTIEKIVEKLYHYRSDIAHGNISDFENELQIFKNQEHNILPFLTELLRQVLILSLEQPQLLMDLKEC